MLDDSTVDRLVAEVNPELDPPADTDAAWARLLASPSPRRVLPRRRVMVPVLAVCAAGIAFALVNWLPAGDNGSVSAAYAKAIQRGEENLSAGTGPVLYVEMRRTVRGALGVQRFQDRSWQGKGAFRYEGTASGPGASIANQVSDVAMLGGIGAYYVRATGTLHVNRLPANDLNPSMGFSGIVPGGDPLSVMIGILLNVKGKRASASASSVAGVLRQMSRLPGARVTRRGGLVTVSVSKGRYS